MSEILAQIETPPGARTPFTAGLVLSDDRVTETAPILRYMRGWKRSSVRSFCAEQGWSVIIVSMDGELNPFVARAGRGEPARQRIGTAGGRATAALLAEDRDDERQADLVRRQE